MFHLGISQKTATYGVVLDVGSGSVGVGIIKSDHDERLPVIIFSHRVYMRLTTENAEPADRMRKMREALFSACLILSKDGLQALLDYDRGAKIGRILVTCSSPWAHTISRNVEYAPEKEFRVTESLIKDLARSAEDEIAEQIDEAGIAGSFGLSVVERATVNVELNQYQVDHPIGLTGSVLSLTHITGLVPQEILKAVNEVQDKILTHTQMSAHTYMLIVYCVLRDLFPKTTTLTIIDVTAEATEIGIVENGILRETLHVPYGSNTLIRDIAARTKGSPDDIMTYLRGLGEQVMDESIQKRALEHLESYADAVREMFKKIHARRTIPNTMVITALPQLQTLFSMQIPKIASEITGDEYTLLELQKGILDEIATNKNDDIFVTIIARFFHKLHGCGEIETV